MRLQVSSILLVAAALSFSSCATRIQGLTKSADFTYPNVKSGKLVVGGVTSVNGDVDYRKGMSLSNALKTQIVEEREDLSVTHAGMVAKSLGKEAYASILSSIENEGSLSSAQVEMLSAKIQGRRFLVFSKIENDQTNQNRRQIDKTDSNGNATGESEMVSSTSRSVDVSFLVYDLMKKEIAWSGTVNKRDTKESKFSVKKDSGLVSLVKAIKGTEERSTEDLYPYPEAPGQQPLLVRAFRGFAENLPEED